MNALKLLTVFLVGVGELLESAGSVNEVARIDTHLVGLLRSLKSRLRVEVNVGNKRHHAALGTQAAANLANVVGLAHTLRSEAHIVGSGIGNAAALSHACFDVVS